MLGPYPACGGRRRRSCDELSLLPCVRGCPLGAMFSFGESVIYLNPPVDVTTVPKDFVSINNRSSESLEVRVTEFKKGRKADCGEITALCFVEIDAEVDKDDDMTVATADKTDQTGWSCSSL